MNASLLILRVASLGRDAQNERDGAGLRSSVAAAAPSQQHYNLALKWSSHRRVPPRGAAGSTSRRDAAAPRGGTIELRAASAPSQHQLRRSSISSVAAAGISSSHSSRRRQCPATMSGRRGFYVVSPPDRHQTVSYSELFTRKSLGHSPEGEVKILRFLGVIMYTWGFI